MKSELIIVLCLLVYLHGCSSWEIASAGEVRQWYVTHAKQRPDQYSAIFYRGSDSKYHHFVCRAVDRWAIFKVRRDEIPILEIHPFSGASGGSFPGYYAVDPLNGFSQTANSGEAL